MQKEDYEEFKESIALAEFFVEMKANQTQKEAKQAQKEASKKNVMAKKIAAKAANKINCSVKCSTWHFYSTP